MLVNKNFFSLDWPRQSIKRKVFSNNIEKQLQHKKIISLKKVFTN